MGNNVSKKDIGTRSNIEADCSHSMEAQTAHVYSEPLPSDKSRAKKKKEKRRQKKGEPMPSYPMNKKPRGIAVLINNTIFEKNGIVVQNLTRHGSEKDLERMEDVFNKMKFSVKIFQDLKHSDIYKELNAISQLEDHNNYDAFICCIMTHGENGNVLGVNCKPFPIKRLMDCFTADTSPHLAGKPKLFFIQACQGSVEQEGVTRNQCDGACESENFAEISKIIANDSDFVLSLSTIPGYVSYRDTEEGAFYIESLAKHLDKYAEREDIIQILTRVNGDVSSKVYDGDNKTQMPAPTTTLTKRCVFYRI